jgi:AbrB family looped-hinge helix DNA binding protein
MKEQIVTVNESGRIVLPIFFRRKLDIKSGDELILSLSSNNNIIVHSPKQSLQKLQNLAAKKNKKNLVEAAIKMRRKEEI